MELDHIFMLVDANGSEDAQLSRLGFAESYRRTHPGQGTANVCYCFDNLFFELLWVHDTAEVCGDLIRRTKLFERSRWRDLKTCPFGIAWRGQATSEISCWTYSPPYMPHGEHIPVAIDSDDPGQPMIFRSPGLIAPIDWPDGQRRPLQRGSGFGAVVEVRLEIPTHVQPCSALGPLEDETVFCLGQLAGTDYSLTLAIERLDGGIATLRLPGLQLG